MNRDHWPIHFASCSYYILVTFHDKPKKLDCRSLSLPSSVNQFLCFHDVKIHYVKIKFKSILNVGMTSRTVHKAMYIWLLIKYRFKKLYFNLYFSSIYQQRLQDKVHYAIEHLVFGIYTWSSKINIKLTIM